MPPITTQLTPGGPTILKDSGTGKNFYVNSAGTGSATSGGLSPETALLTIQQAIDLCTASVGDTIWVMPGHAENVASATALKIATAGINIIGLGEGAQQPTISFTAAAGALVIAAANAYVKNLRLVSNFTTGVTNGISVEASGCTLEDIVMRETTNAKEFLIGIAVATAISDLHIIRLDLQGLVSGSMTGAIVFAGTSIGFKMVDSIVHCDASGDLVDHLTGASVNALVQNCILISQDTTAAGYAIRFKADGTGAVINCRLAVNKIDAEVSLGAAVWWLGNIGCNTIAEGGIVEPASTSAIP